MRILFGTVLRSEIKNICCAVISFREYIHSIVHLISIILNCLTYNLYILIILSTRVNTLRYIIKCVVILENYERASD